MKTPPPFFPSPLSSLLLHTLMLPLYTVFFFLSFGHSPLFSSSCTMGRIHAQREMNAEERVSVNERNGKREIVGYLGRNKPTAFPV